jgi:hypothetical protein
LKDIFQSEISIISLKQRMFRKLIWIIKSALPFRRALIILQDLNDSIPAETYTRTYDSVRAGKPREAGWVRVVVNNNKAAVIF